jgi:hypothetical protein
MPPTPDVAPVAPNARPRAKAKAPPGWKAVFLATLARGANVTVAARKAGVSRMSVYRARRDDPKFAEGFLVALEEACDLFESWVAHLAAEGSMMTITREEYDAAGKLVRRIVETREQPETQLLLAFLAAHRPEKWRANFDARKVAELIVSLHRRQAGLPYRPQAVRLPASRAP